MGSPSEGCRGRVKTPQRKGVSGDHAGPGTWAAHPKGRHAEQLPARSLLPGMGSPLPWPRVWKGALTAAGGAACGGYSDPFTVGFPGVGLATPTHLPLRLQDAASVCKKHQSHPSTGSQNLGVEAPTPSAGSSLPLQPISCQASTTPARKTWLPSSKTYTPHSPPDFPEVF